MNSRQFQPSSFLAPFIKYYWTISSLVEETNVFRFAPDGHPEIVFNLSGEMSFSLNGNKFSDPNAQGICGQFNQYLDLDISKNELSFFIKFQPNTLSCFFNENCASFANGIYTPPQLCVLSRELRDTYNSSKNIFEVIQKTELWLCQNLKRPQNFEIISQLTRQIQQEYKVPIHDILDQYGLSKRRLQQIFKENVGISPKQYQRLIRFRKAMNQLKHTPDKESFIYALGYYDWSHFSKDMYYYFEMSPSDYVYYLFQEGHLINVQR